MTTLPGLLTVSIEEVESVSPHLWKTIIRNPDDNETQNLDLQDPIQDQDEHQLLTWYLEDYVNDPFSKPKAKIASDLVTRYRTNLFKQLKPFLDRSEEKPVLLQIILTDEHHGIDQIAWELLEDQARYIRVQRLYTPCPVSRTSEKVHSIVSQPRLMVVTARSYTKLDVTPRLTTLPLVESAFSIGLESIKLDYVRPGTFTEFKKRLAQTRGEVRMIHFDLHGDVDPVEGATLEFVDSKYRKREKRSAREVAELLSQHGVNWVVLCACRTAMSTPTTTHHLALELMRHGIHGVVAMRYELKSSGAAIAASAFYDAMCKDGKSFVEAAMDMRRAMRGKPERLAKYGQEVIIPDHMVPTIYTRPYTDFRFQHQTIELAAQESPAPIFGREDDIQQIERRLIMGSSQIILVGEAMVGKSHLLQHLAWWWRASAWYQTAITVDLSDPDIHSWDCFGIARVQRALRRAIHWLNPQSREAPESSEALVEIFEALKERNAIIFVDGLDEIYNTSCDSQDTEADWLKFFEVTERLASASLVPIIFGASDLVPGIKDKLQNQIYHLSGLGTSAAAQLLEARGIKIASLEDASNENPETKLANTLELLDHNPLLISRHGSRFEEPFAGIENLLSWNHESEVDAVLSVADCRIDRLLQWIMSYVKSLGQNLVLLGIVVLGTFTDVVPDVSVSARLLMSLLEWQQLDAQALIDIIYNSSSDLEVPTPLPFALWQNSRKSLGLDISLMEADVIDICTKAIEVAQNLLAAAALIRKNDTAVLRGLHGHHISAAARLWIRQYARAHLPASLRAHILESLETIYEDRAVGFFADKPGESARTIPSTPHLYSEKWNLVSVVVQARRTAPRPLTSTGLVSRWFNAIKDAVVFIDPSTLSFPFVTFIAIAPHAATDDGFVTPLLFDVILSYLRIAEKHLTSGVLDTKVLNLINWSIDYSLRHRNLSHEDWLRRLSNTLLDQQLAVSATAGEPLTQTQRAALISDLAAATRSNDRSRISASIARVKRARTASVSIGDDGDDAILGFLVDFTIPLLESADFTDSARLSAYFARVKEATSERQLPPVLQRFLSAWADSMCANLVISASKGSLSLESALFEGTSEEAAAHTRALVIQVKMNAEGFNRGIPERYMKHVSALQLQAARGDVVSARRTAETALRVAERYDDAFAAGKWRMMAEFLGQLDRPFDYEGMQQSLLEHCAKKQSISNSMLRMLALGDTPQAYRHAKGHLGMFEMVGNESGVMFCKAMIETVEPYKEQRLELGPEWYEACRKFARFLLPAARQQAAGLLK